MTSGAQAHQSAANVLAPNLSLDLALTASPESSPARAAATDHPDNSNAANAAPPGVKQAALSNAPGSIEQQPDAPQTGSVQPTLHSLLGKDGDTVDSQGSFLVSKDVQSVHQHVNSAGKHGLSVVSKDVQSEQQHARQPFRREQQDQDGVTRPRHGLSDPNKRLLAQMGSSSAANASRELMQEVGARANVQGLLQASHQLFDSPC